MKTKQRVIISADVFRYWLAGDGVVKHPTHGYAVDVSTPNTKTNYEAIDGGQVRRSLSAAIADDELLLE